MAIPSTMGPLGTKAVDFYLQDSRDDAWLSLADYPEAKAFVLMFLCNHCPYVKHVQPKLVELANLYQTQGIQFIAISSNDVQTYPEDSYEKMHQEANEHQYPFPYLYDESQEVAKAYGAACTPDFFVFDNEKNCVYRGCLDESTPRNQKPLTGEYLQQALEALLAGKPIDSNQKPSMGCGIKWKAD